MTNSMLFDLKGKRKRLVQVVYLGLAILFGGGLVLFGVGGNVSGGLIDAFKGTGSADTSAFTDQVERAERRGGAPTRARPTAGSPSCGPSSTSRPRRRAPMRRRVS